MSMAFISCLYIIIITFTLIVFEFHIVCLKHLVEKCHTNKVVIMIVIKYYSRKGFRLV